MEDKPGNEKIQDVALIDSRIKGMADQIYQEKKDQYQDINELVEEAFIQGLKEILTSEGKPEKVREDFLVEDEFEYYEWQLNLHPGTEKELEWAEIKSDILLRGLKNISD